MLFSPGALCSALMQCTKIHFHANYGKSLNVEAVKEFKWSRAQIQPNIITY